MIRFRKSTACEGVNGDNLERMLASPIVVMGYC